MMEEVIFLFVYHELNALTRRHFECLRSWHPRDEIVPLVYQFKSREVLPGTIDVALDWDYGWPINSPWHEADKIMLRWYHRLGRPQARRYVFFEYDILANAPAPVFYSDAWNADAAAAKIPTPEHAPQWPWFEQSHRLGEYFPHRAGAVPLGGTLWSDAVLSRIARQPALQNCFSELRMATLARHHGFRLQLVPGAAKTMSWRPGDIQVTEEPTWFHPVKA